MEFMKETNVEVVARWFKWVFLRKKASDGPFEMYTDAESKIESYTKIKKMFQRVGILEFLVLLYEIVGAWMIRTPILIGCAIIIGLLFIGVLKVTWKCQWKIEELKRTI